MNTNNTVYLLLLLSFLSFSLAQSWTLASYYTDDQCTQLFGAKGTPFPSNTSECIPLPCSPFNYSTSSPFYDVSCPQGADPPIPFTSVYGFVLYQDDNCSNVEQFTFFPVNECLSTAASSTIVKCGEPTATEYYYNDDQCQDLSYSMPLPNMTCGEGGVTFFCYP